jgi:hypothetical protein
MAHSDVVAEYEGTPSPSSIPTKEDEMPVDYAEVLKELEAEEGRLMTELNTIRSAKPAILRLLENQKFDELRIDTTPVLPVGRFVSMGATKSIPIYLKDKTMALTSRQIMDGLKAEGWTSESGDHLATVSATLSQLRDKGILRKIGDGWMMDSTPLNAIPSNDVVTKSPPAPNSFAATHLYPNASRQPSEQ